MKKLAFLILFPVYACFGQQEFDYYPLQTKLTEDESKQLRKEIISRLKTDLKDIECKYEKQVKDIYMQRSKWLLEKIADENFIHDEIISTYLASLLDIIVENNPSISANDVRILVQRDPNVNAYCAGEGTLIMNVGLLRRIETESQLAFVIAHELAHLELDHVNKSIVSKLESVQSKETKQKEKDIRKNGRAPVIEKLELHKGLLYSELKHQRSYEFEADSLARIFLANTPYDQHQAIDFLQMLDSADFPKYSDYEGIESVFNFSKFPFQSSWLQDEDSLFSRHFNSSLIFDADSVSTHPDIEERISKMQAMLDPSRSKKLDIEHPDELDWIVTMCDFEAIESAYKMKDYSRCMYLTLQALSKYRDISYLHAMIGKIFIDLYEVGDHPTRKEYMFGFDNYYSADLRQIKTFLQNLNQWELGQIALNYMNTRGNFDPSDESHYYLLWNIGDMINNLVVMEQVEEAYADAFPNGKYLHTFFYE